MADLLRFQPPVPPAPSRYTPKNPDLLDARQVAHELGISRSTLERKLIEPGSQIPKPWGNSHKRLWLRTSVHAYRDALALLGRRPRGRQPR